MSEGKHTPGPWVVDLEGPFTLGGDIVSVEALTPDGKVSREIATFMVDSDEWPDGDGWKEDAANARLIAAAPDLLEALEEAIGLCHTPKHAQGDDWFERFEKCQAAPTRAKGEAK